MILAIDPGIASCGWAIVQSRTVDSPVRVVDLGVWTSEPNAALGKSTDRARRIGRLGLEIGRLYRLHGVTMLAAEQALSFGRTSGLIGQAMVWGALVMLAAEHRCDVREVTAKQWQRAIVPGIKGKMDYPFIAQALARYIGDGMLKNIDPDLRTHALDAVGVGLFASLRPTTRVS